MSQKDYSKNLATAKRLVAKYGRQVSIVKLKQTSADPDKPWESPADARTDPEAQANVFGTPVPPSSQTSLGLKALSPELAKQVEQIFILEPGSTDPDNLESYHLLMDSSTEYKILAVEKFRPGDTTLLYFMWVGR